MAVIFSRVTGRSGSKALGLQRFFPRLRSVDVLDPGVRRLFPVVSVLSPLSVAVPRSLIGFGP